MSSWFPSHLPNYIDYLLSYCDRQDVLIHLPIITDNLFLLVFAVVQLKYRPGCPRWRPPSPAPPLQGQLQLCCQCEPSFPRAPGKKGFQNKTK